MNREEKKQIDMPICIILCEKFPKKEEEKKNRLEF